MKLPAAHIPKKNDIARVRIPYKGCTTLSITFFSCLPFYNSNQKGEGERALVKLGHVMDREPDMAYNFFAENSQKK